MRVLALQHHPGDRTGTLGEFLRSHGAEVMLAKVFQDQSLPQDGFDAVVRTGGTMSAYDIKNHPYLSVEIEFPARFAQKGGPVPGLCLGGQLLAKALGGEVMKSPIYEAGWRKLHLTEDGRQDPLFQGIEDGFTALEFHGDAFALPQGAVHPAQGEDCPNQAFRLKQAYGL